MMNIKNEHVLVTGAAGFVGTCLTRALIDKGVKPHVIVQGSSDLWRLRDVKSRLFIHAGDLTDAKWLRRLVQRIRPTIIYHFAAHGAYPVQTDANRIFTTNLMGTLYLLQALEGVEYKLFVNTGSSSEYGFKQKPMREDELLMPNSYYAVSKAAQTLLCQYVAAAQKKAIVTFRLFSVYGPYEEPTRLVPTLVRSCLQGKDLGLTSPRTARDFIFVGDVIKAYLSIARLCKAGGHVFNIGTGRQTNLKQITSVVLKLTKAKVALRWGAVPGRIWDTSTWVGDVSKARKLLGFSARTSLEQGLAKTIAWTKQHG